MPAPLMPDEGHVPSGRPAGHHPRTAWAMALTGAGGVCTVLAVVPVLGIYLALVTIPILYAVGVPLAVHTFTRTADRERHWHRLVGGGAVVGALVTIVPFVVVYLFEGPYDGVLLLGQVLLFTAAGVVVAVIALVTAGTLPTRHRTAVAIGGPILLLVSATVQVTLWL